MSKKLFLWLIALLFAGIVAASPAISSTIDLILLDNDIHVGETFDVQVYVNRSSSLDPSLGLTSFGFDTSSDGDWSVFSYSEYTLYDSISGPGSFSVIDSFVGDLFFPADYNTSILLATLTFEALGFGTDTLTVSGQYDEDFYGLMYEFIDPYSGIGINLGELGVDSFNISANLSITVNEAAVPEPATMLLFGLGLIGLAGMGRKKSFSI